MVEVNPLDGNLGTRIRPVLMLLPDHDFDPTETAIPWKTCTSRGWNITISTENGTVP
jgi:hypothetical protein